MGFFSNLFKDCNDCNKSQNKYNINLTDNKIKNDVEKNTYDDDDDYILDLILFDYYF